MSPSPNRYHQDISRNLEVLIANFLEEHPIGKIYDAPFDVYLTPHDVFQPDLAFIANDRFSILTHEGTNGAPTWVAEILSPGNSKLDRSTKKAVYASAGVDELWIIDPNAKTIEVFRLQENPNNPRETFPESATFTSTCFPGLEFDSRKIFKQ